MARAARVPEPRPEARPTEAPAPRLTIVPRAEPRPSPEPEANAATGMHPRAFLWPMLAVAWFLSSMAISFADTLETGYLMAIVVGFAIIFFGLMLGLGIHAGRSERRFGSPSSFRRFLNSEVGVYTGRIRGREAMLQLTVLPVTLALGGTAIGLVYLFVR